MQYFSRLANVLCLCFGSTARASMIVVRGPGLSRYASNRVRRNLAWAR